MMFHLSEPTRLVDQHGQLRVLAHLGPGGQNVSADLRQAQPGHYQAAALYKLEVPCSGLKGGRRLYCSLKNYCCIVMLYCPLFHIYVQGGPKKSVLSKNENRPWWGFFEKKNP